MEGAKCTQAEVMSHALLVKDTFSGSSCILHCIDLSLGKPALATVQRVCTPVRAGLADGGEGQGEHIFTYMYMYIFIAGISAVFDPLLEWSSSYDFLQQHAWRERRG